MFKILSIILILFVLLSMFMPSKADAADKCNVIILAKCYDSCKEYFSSDLLRSACYAGCLIACYTSGSN